MKIIRESHFPRKNLQNDDSGREGKQKEKNPSRHDESRWKKTPNVK